MTTDSKNANRRFLGIDWSSLPDGTRELLQRAGGTRALAWLKPAVTVRVLRADGSVVDWSQGRVAPVLDKSASPAPAFMAVELPEALLLRRTLTTPVMQRADLDSAVLLDVRGASPFAPEDLVWGYTARPQGEASQRIEIALASRQHVSRHLGEAAGRLPAGITPEAWAWGPYAEPVVLSGFGEGRRLHDQGAWQRTGYLLLLLALLLLAAIAITPTAQLRLRAIEAVNAYTGAAQKAAPLLQKREALLKATENLTALEQSLAERVEPLATMDLLTRVLPDDTYLQTLHLQSGKITISGQTANAAALMQRLSAEPGLLDVRAPVAAMRVPGASKEAFSIEFGLDPKVHGPGRVLGSTVAASPAVAGAPALPASAPAGAAGGASAAVAAVPAIPASRPPPPVLVVNRADKAPGTPSVAAGGFSIGGGAPAPAAPASKAP